MARTCQWREPRFISTAVLLYQIITTDKLGTDLTRGKCQTEPVFWILDMIAGSFLDVAGPILLLLLSLLFDLQIDGWGPH